MVLTLEKLLENEEAQVNPYYRCRIVICVEHLTHRCVLLLTTMVEVEADLKFTSTFVLKTILTEQSPESRSEMPARGSSSLKAEIISAIGNIFIRSA